jgi:DNA-binding transcriptional MerR regulator
MGVEIPDKLYFRIGEVSRLTRTPQYVLRFWETQFPQLKVRKSSTGQRMFRRREVEMVLEIKDLLYKQGFTIDGARKKMAHDTRQPDLPFQNPSREKLRRVCKELRELLELLNSAPVADNNGSSRKTSLPPE